MKTNDLRTLDYLNVLIIIVLELLWSSACPSPKHNNKDQYQEQTDLLV